MTSSATSPIPDQVTPFAKRMLGVASPNTAEYDAVASLPSPPVSPMPPQNPPSAIHQRLSSTKESAGSNKPSTNPPAATSASAVKHTSSGGQPKRPRRSIGPYQLTRTLGSGSMGKVKLAINSETDEKSAVKIIPRKAPIHKSAPKDESRDIRIHREIALMMLLDHPYIVSLKEAMVMPHHYYLFFEYVSGGQILDYIISHGKLKEKQARKFARQMISAIDLKIENILITEEGDIKIIDFGLSNLFSTSSQLSTFCGSLYFAAPELLSAQEYTGPEVDIWSLGIVFYVLVCGRVPFDDPNMPALHAKIKKGNVSYPTWLSKECKHLLTRMLVTNPNERATMAELMRHPWITKGYDEPIDNYYPTHRQPITLPLDMHVIHRMKGFEFGNDEKIKADLEELLGSSSSGGSDPPAADLPANGNKMKDLRKMAFFNHKSGGANGNRHLTDGFHHPLISVYYLVQEKMERERKLDDLKRSNKKRQISEVKRNSGGNTLPEILEPDEENGEHDPMSPTRDTNSNSANKGIRFDGNTNDNSSNNKEEVKSPNMLRRLSSAVRPGKSLAFHRLSHGPETTSSTSSHNNSKGGGYGERFSRRISRLITRHVSMQEPKLRNSMSELDSLVNKDAATNTPKSPLSQAPAANPSTNPTPSPNPLPADPTTEDEEHHLTARTTSLKGLFSVATTSTKKAKHINQDLTRVLQKLNIRWKETEGYLECVYVDPMHANHPPQAVHSDDSSDNEATNRPARNSPDDEGAENGGGLVLGEEEEEVLAKSPLLPEIPAMAVLTGGGLLTVPSDSNDPRPSNVSSTTSPRDRPSQDHQPRPTPNNLTPGPTTTNPHQVRFQISLVKIRVVLRLHGIQFRRLEGPSWEYKAVCSKILAELKL